MIAATLLVGCGRTPVQVLQTEIRSEPTFDPVADGCSKVDYLFVVDNSSSMGDNQWKLAHGIDIFLDGIEDVLDEVDSVHAGVLTTDGYDHNHPDCRRIGALVSQTGGHNSSGEVCGPFAEGGRYLTEADDLTAGLECLLRVGTTGSTAEQPLTALRRAVDPADDTVEACNAGFLRSDALLVVVFITDEDASTNANVYDAVVDAKGGQDEAVVVLTIAHTGEPGCVPHGHAQVATNLMQFTGWFEHGLSESICAASFESAFDRTAQVVKAACGG